jgi:TIR domain
MAKQVIDSGEVQQPVTQSAPLQQGLADGRRQRSLTAFISYTRQSDTESRNRLAQKLQADGIEPRGDWLLTPGPSYRDQLASMIRESDVFIALISPLSVASQGVREEIDQANLYKKRLLPVLIRDGFDKALLHDYTKGIL